MPEVSWPGQESWEDYSKKSQSEAWNYIVKEEELWGGLVLLKRRASSR